MNVLIQYPTPYKLISPCSVGGNTQLPTLDSGSFMVSKKLIDKLSLLLADNGDIINNLLLIVINY